MFVTVKEWTPTEIRVQMDNKFNLQKSGFHVKFYPTDHRHNKLVLKSKHA